jgi:membrane protease YdiL (CAAX protease family)
MSDSDPFLTTPSTDLQQTPTPTVGDIAPLPPREPPKIGLPTRSLVHDPRWPHPNLGWSLLWCLLFILVTQIPGAVIAGIIVVGLTLIAPDRFPIEGLSKPDTLMKSSAMNVALAVAMLITELLVIGFSWLVIRLVVGRDWMRQLAVRRPGLAHTLLAVASFPALVLLGNAAYAVLRELMHVPSLTDYGLSGMEEMLKIFSTWPWGFAVLVIGLGPGIGEELWCRGFLGRGLVGNYGAVFGIIATSFLFGLIHIDPCQGAMAAVMGLWLHFVYLTTRSLWLPMLLHFMNNSLAVLITRSAQLAFIESEPGDIPLFVFFSAGLLLVGVAYALYQSRARLATMTPQQIVLWRPQREGVEYPPDGSGMRVTHPIPSLLALLLVAGGFILFVLACLAWALRV